MSATFQCMACEFTTASVQRAETHERNRQDHEVYERDITTPEESR